MSTQKWHLLILLVERNSASGYLWERGWEVFLSLEDAILLVSLPFSFVFYQFMQISNHSTDFKISMSPSYPVARIYWSVSWRSPR